MSTRTTRSSNKRKAVEPVEPVSPPATATKTKTKKPRVQSSEEESVGLQKKVSGVKNTVAVGVKKAVGQVDAGEPEAEEDSHENGHDHDEDDEDYEGSDGNVDVEEERAIAAEEEAGMPDRVEEDDEQIQDPDEETERPLVGLEEEKVVGEPTGASEKKKRSVPVRRIEKFNHVDLGRIVSEQDQNEMPSDELRRANIEAFRKEWRHTVTKRCQRAADYTQWPLPKDCEFSPAAKHTLVKMGVEGAMEMSLKYLTLYRQEVLGRGRLHPFGLDDVKDLPALLVSQQHSHVTYLDLVEDHNSGDSLYTGSASGKQGAAQRWHDYDTAKRLGHAKKSEANSLHFKAFLQRGSVLHLRPLMIFADSVPSTHIELMEALMKDFLETIDRTNLSEVRINGGFLLHNAAMLECSKDAFPPERQHSLCKGLNKVSAFKQARFPRWNQDCPVNCGKCTKEGRPRVVYRDNDPIMICPKCHESFYNYTRNRELTGKWHEAFIEFAKIRAGVPVQRKILIGLTCQHCNEDFMDLRQHEKRCRKNPNREAPEFICQHCEEPKGTTKANLAQHEKICKKNLNREAPKFICQHCDEQKGTSKKDLTTHEKTCKKNLNREAPQHMCQHCHEQKGSTLSNLRTHEKRCQDNPVNKKSPASMAQAQT